MARRAPAPSDADQDEVPPAEAPTSCRPVRESARGAHKVWEPMIPKPKAPKDGEVKKKKDPKKSAPTKPAKKAPAPKYAPPDIALNTSDDEAPPPRRRLSKRASATALERLSNDDEQDGEQDGEQDDEQDGEQDDEQDGEKDGEQDDEQDGEKDEVPVNPRKLQGGRSKGKGRAESRQSSEEENSNSGDEERSDEEDEESSGSSGLEELERNNPSALKAKFDSEAPAWVDNDNDDVFGGDHSASPPASPRAASPTLDASDAPKAPKAKPKRPRADSSESEKDVRSKSFPAQKKPKAARSVDTSEEDADSLSAEDAAATKAKEKRADERKRERKHEQERERKRKREREARREREKEQMHADRAKERAKERERQRKELKEYHEHEAARDREEERERKREADRERMKQREQENERKRQEDVSRKMERSREMEREYEHEHEMLRKRLQVGSEKGKDRGRKQVRQERKEMPDEQDRARGSSHKKTRSTVGSQRTAVSSRSSPRSNAASSSKAKAPPSRSAGKAALKAMAAPTSSSSKRKRGKQDEEIAFVSDKGSDDSDKEPPPRRRRQHVDDQLAPSDDDNNTSVEIVWFGNSRPNLTDQHPRVKQVANLAIADCELSVCTVNAFPDDPDEDDSFTRNILIKHAKALDYKIMTKLLRDKKDNTYWKKLSTIPAQRVYLLRGKVKGKCEGAVRAAYGLTVGDSEKVAWLEKDLAYIFPHNYENRTVVGTEGYAPGIFEDMLATSFFSRRQSYGYRIAKHFTSSHPDKPDEKEIPAAMLALVSTAIFAAIDDFKHAHFDAAKFEVNPNLHVYRRNIAFLDHIKDKNIDAYHVLMHGLFKSVTGNFGGASNVGQGIGYLNVDGMKRS